MTDLKSVAELEQRGNELLEKERLQKEEIARDEAELRQLREGLGWLRDANDQSAPTDRRLNDARRLLQLKAQAAAIRPRELPVGERNELHELALAVPAQAVRAVHLAQGLTTKREALAATGRALAAARKATDEARARDPLAELRRRRPRFVAQAEAEAKRAVACARIVDQKAKEFAAALRELHLNCEAPLCATIDTERAWRVLSIQSMRGRVHEAVANHFEVEPDHAQGRGLYVTFTVPGAQGPPPRRRPLAECVAELYATLIAEAVKARPGGHDPDAEDAA